MSFFSFAFSELPVITAEKYIEYKKANGHMGQFVAPKIVLICYQQSTLKYILKLYPDITPSDSFSNLYLMQGGQTGLLGGWGIGAPALAVKLEQLIALGVTKFVAVGTAGALMNAHSIGDFVISPKALPEDGVAHLYLPKNKSFADADERLFLMWNEFVKKRQLPNFQPSTAWSFSAVYRETPSDVRRVTEQGCGIVEMEAATLYAIGSDKGVQTVSLFVISDSVTTDAWVPQLREDVVRDNLHKLAEWALEFCENSNLK